MEVKAAQQSTGPNIYSNIMVNRRARNMDWGGDRLEEVLKRLAIRPIPPAHVLQFKTSQNNGQADNEYFINRFEEIMEANKWRHAVALLHLWESLKERAEDYEGIGKYTSDLYYP